MGWIAAVFGSLDVLPSSKVEPVRHPMLELLSGLRGRQYTSVRRAGSKGLMRQKDSAFLFQHLEGT